MLALEPRWRHPRDTRDGRAAVSIGSPRGADRSCIRPRDPESVNHKEGQGRCDARKRNTAGRPHHCRVEYRRAVRRLRECPAGGRPAVRRRLPGRETRHCRVRAAARRAGDRAADHVARGDGGGTERPVGRAADRGTARAVHVGTLLPRGRRDRRRARRAVGRRLRVRGARQDQGPARLQLSATAGRGPLRPDRARGHRRARPLHARRSRAAAGTGTSAGHGSLTILPPRTGGGQR